MNIVIFDTETTSLDKPFCYNVGYNIVDVDSRVSLVKREYVVEQVWHNQMAFCSAYYANRRPFYVAEMRKHNIIMSKWGYICQQMVRDFKAYNVQYAYAYNSGFDERVFEFNCDWFKTANPFDNVPIYDIRGYAVKMLVDDEYKAFCEMNNYFTETGNYSTTAEIMFRYIAQNCDFTEAHTALNDAIIETDILFMTMDKGADITIEEKAPKAIERAVEHDWTICHKGTKMVLKAKSVRVIKGSKSIILK